MSCPHGSGNSRITACYVSAVSHLGGQTHLEMEPRCHQLAFIAPVAAGGPGALGTIHSAGQGNTPSPGRWPGFPKAPGWSTGQLQPVVQVHSTGRWHWCACSVSCLLSPRQSHGGHTPHPGSEMAHAQERQWGLPHSLLSSPQDGSAPPRAPPGCWPPLVISHITAFCQLSAPHLADTSSSFPADTPNTQSLIQRREHGRVPGHVLSTRTAWLALYDQCILTSERIEATENSWRFCWENINFDNF